MMDIKFNHLIGLNKAKHKGSFVKGTFWANKHRGMPESVCVREKERDRETSEFFFSSLEKRKERDGGREIVRQWFHCETLSIFI